MLGIPEIDNDLGLPFLIDADQVWRLGARSYNGTRSLGQEIDEEEF